MKSHDVDEATAFWVNLAAEELFTNMIRHNRSTGNRIEAHLEITARDISMSLTDFGVPPFEPDSVPEVDPTLSAAERTPGGLGVFIVRSKTDDLSYRHDDGNMTVSFTKNREVPA